MVKATVSIDGSAFLQEIAEHHGADQGRRVWNENDAGRQHRQGKEDQFDLLDRPKLDHLDLSLRLSREQPHDRGLDDRNQSHIGIGGDRDRAQQVGRELAGQENRRRSIGAANDADRGGIAEIEVDEIEFVAQRQRTDQGGKDAELCRRPQQRRLRMRQQRTEIRHRPDAEKDQQREEPVADAHVVDDSEETVGTPDVGNRDIREQSAKPNRDQQEGLEAAPNPEIEQQETDRHHHRLAGREVRESRRLPEFESDRFEVQGAISTSASPVLTA